MKPENPHILTLPENTDGEDVIIGDVHGNANLLRKVIGQLNQEDRLMIVGDLVDRGKGSLDVIKLIKAHSPGGAKPTIYVVQGNHEHFFLEYAQLKLNGEDIAPIRWWIDHEHVDAAWAKKLSLSELQDTHDVIASLPYILHVTGKKPYNIVHADMPFDIEQLQHKINNHELLTDREIMHAIDARENHPDYAMNKKIVSDCITYCGHTIVAGSRDPSVRQHTNTINLDVGAYYTNCFVTVHHKAGLANVIGESDQEINDDVVIVAMEVNAFLKNKHFLSPLINNLAAILRGQVAGIHSNEKTPDMATAKLVTSLNKALTNLTVFNNAETFDLNRLQQALKHISDAKVAAATSGWSLFSFFLKDDSLIKEIEVIERQLILIDERITSSVKMDAQIKKKI